VDDLPDILTGISKPGLFEKFREQLKKDFEGAGLNGDFALGLEPDYEMIVNAVSSEIEKVNRSAASKLTGLLYRIDISELQVRKLSMAKPEHNDQEILAELIIKRELQKIIIKEHYRNK
jgi:hypothetical protein